MYVKLALRQRASRSHRTLVAVSMLLGALVTSAAVASVASSQTSAEGAAAAQFDSVRENPLLLYAFLRAMPKGGDLHNHPSGSEYAEQYIAYAVEDGLCVRRDTMTLVQ